MNYLAFSRWMAALFLAVCGRVSFAQTWEVFDVNTAGFPSMIVTDIDEDGAGNIWVGTDYGLCKYDGVSWTVYQSANSGLPDNGVTALAVDSLDRVWVGTVLGGLAVFDGASDWAVYTTGNSGLPDDQIKCITIDHRGWVWVGTFLGLACYTGDEWRLYNDQPDSYGGLVLNGAVIQDVQIRDDGLVAIGTLNGGFHYMTESIVEAHATYIDQFFDNTQNGVAFDTVSGDRWLASPSQGLLRNFGDWQGGTWFQYAVWNSSIPSNSLLCVAMDAQGRPWVGSVDAGILIREPNDSFLSYNEQNSGLPDNGVTCLHFASDGSLWAGTYEGGAARMTMNVAVPERVLGASVFPNPCSDHCTVQVAPAMGAGLEWFLLDASGREVARGREGGVGAFRIDTRGLAPGLLTLHVVGDGAVTIVRLAKS